MNPNQRSNIHLYIIVLALMLCLPVIGSIAFNRGRDSGFEKARVTAEVSQAITKLESSHDVREWKDKQG